MNWDPFNDYRKNGYLQNIHRLPLGDDLKQLEHEDFAVFLPDALLYLSQCVSPSYDDLLEVHKIVSEELYPTWAGKDRDENVRKGNIVFCELHFSNIRRGSYGWAMCGDESVAQTTKRQDQLGVESLHGGAFCIPYENVIQSTLCNMTRCARLQI